MKISISTFNVSLDLIKEENYVNIALEYVESGSIDSLVKKMGGWP